MRRTLCYLVFVLVCIPVWSEGLPSGLAGEITRALDRFGPALERAVRDAQRGDLSALQQSLETANEVWSNLYRRYRGIIPNDMRWDEDFDTINSAMRAAVNEVSPNANPAGAKTYLDEAVATLQALRSRNRVPDVQAALKELLASVRAMQATAHSLRGKELEPADAMQLQEEWQATTDAWKQFTEAVVEVNALGLDPRRLDKVKKLVALQDRAFKQAGIALETRDRLRALAGLNEAEAPLLRLLAAIGAMPPRR